MSTLKTEEAAQNALPLGGAIRKGLLTPYRRLGLSRKTSKSNSFISPLQSKEPILIDNISLSPVNQNANETSKSKSFDSPLAKKEQILIDNILSPIDQIPNKTTIEKICTTPIIPNKHKNASKKNNSVHCQNSNAIKQKSPKTKESSTTKISCENREKKGKGNEKLSEDNIVNTFIEKENNISSSKMLDTIKNASESSTNKSVDTNSHKSDIDSIIDRNSTQPSKKSKLNEDDIDSIYSHISSDHDYFGSDHDDFVKTKNAPTENIGKNKNQCEVQEIIVNMQESLLNTNLDARIILHRLEDGKCKKKSDKVNNIIETPYYDLQNVSTETTSTKDQQIGFKKNRLNTDNENSIFNIKRKEKSCKSFKRKLSLRKSTSSIDLCESGEQSNTVNEQDNIKVFTDIDDGSKIIDEIIKLETIVENKEDELHRLQQAQIYRNKHKTEVLKAETSVWKNGCQDAVRDLLIKLNEHNSIDMNTLLSKLKVPPHLITYDIENDCFL